MLLISLLALILMQSPITWSEAVIPLATPTGSTCTATAIAVDPPHLVTAAHCLMPGVAQIVVAGAPATVLAVDPTLDVALLRWSRVPAMALPLREARPQLGETALLIGYGYGATQPVYSWGRVSSLEMGTGLALDLEPMPGASGGAIVDSAGELLGIFIGWIGPNTGPTLARAVPVADLGPLMAAAALATLASPK